VSIWYRLLAFPMTHIALLVPVSMFHPVLIANRQASQFVASQDQTNQAGAARVQPLGKGAYENGVCANLHM